MTTRIVRSTNLTQTSIAIEAQLREWPGFGGLVIVERDVPVPKQPDRYPWIGVYRQAQLLSARTLGAGAGYRRHNADYLLVLCESSAVSGQECADRLEALVSGATSALLSDESLRGNADTLGPEMRIVYTSYEQTASRAYTQTATIQFTTESAVNVEFV